MIVDKIEPGIDLLLSWPFLKEHNINIDSKKKILTLNSFSPIPFYEHKSLPFSCEVRNLHKITINPRSESFISFNHSSLCHFLKTSNLESTFITPSSTLLKTHLRLGAGTLTSKNRKLLIHEDNFAAVLIDEVILPFLGNNNLVESFPYVLIDMGAVRYICNGANIARPGIIKFESLSFSS